jgi:hypothetical protein
MKRAALRDTSAHPLGNWRETADLAIISPLESFS